MSLEFHNEWLLPHAIEHHAKFSGSATAVVCGEERLTWCELERRTRKMANSLLSLNLDKGDKVAMLMTSGIDSFVLMWGVIRAGGVIVSLNVMLAPDSLAAMLDASEARWLFADAANAAQIERVRDRLSGIAADGFFSSGAPGGEWRSLETLLERGAESPLEVRIEPEDSISIVYSSGSTGMPKGIEHSHRARFLYIFGLGHYMGYDRDSAALLATPLYTNGTWMTMAPCMYRGGKVVIMPKFSPEGFLSQVARDRVTHVFLVPTQTIQIVNHEAFATADLSSLTNIISAGQPLDSKVFEQVVESLPGLKLWDAYGLSEGFCTLAGPADWARGKRGSVGKAFLLDDIRIVDGDQEVPQGATGEICGYSVGNMKGYYREPERTEEMLWRGPDGRSYLRSGDLGRIDEDGYLYIQGRKKDMIKSGGINVFPVDIEAVFMQHPAVAEACAIGVPHEKWVETPLLFVVLRPGAQVAAEALMEWGNQRLSRFQRVSGIRFLDDLPRITYGKVDKNRLRAAFWTTDATGKVIPLRS